MDGVTKLLIFMILFAIGLIIAAKFIGEEQENPIFNFVCTCFYILFVQDRIFLVGFKIKIFL